MAMVGGNRQLCCVVICTPALQACIFTMQEPMPGILAEEKEKAGCEEGGEESCKTVEIQDDGPRSFSPTPSPVENGKVNRQSSTSDSGEHRDTIEIQ